MSTSHHQPTEQQLQPLIDKHHATWTWLTRMMFYTVVGVFVILGLMAVFLA